MRRVAAVLLSVGVIAPAIVVLPTVTSSAAPKPVAPKVAHLVVQAGKDAASVRSDAGRPLILTSPQDVTSFQTVGVSWARTEDAPELAVSVRTRSEDGVWSAWDDLDQEGDPDDQTVTRSGTEPMYAGEANGVQAKVEVLAGATPSDLRLDLIDPGSSDYDAAAGATPAGTAAATATQPTILSRSAWGADESRRRGTPETMDTIKAGVLHHTAGINNYSKAQVPKIIRGDYAYHLSRGWNDIGYNFLVDRFGRIWEGRYGGIGNAVMGAHAGGFNTDTFGVSMIGNYDEVRPTAASLEAVARIFAWKLDLYHRNPKGRTQLTSAGGGTAKYPEGRTVTLPVIMGHRDVGSTACPGKYLYPQLGNIRNRVAALMKAALMDPTTSAASVPQATGTATIAATALTNQAWTLTVIPACGGEAVRTVTGSVAAGKRFAATWDGREADGSRARAGSYQLVLGSRSKAGAARTVTSSVTLLPAAPAPVPTGDSTVGLAGKYVPVTPTRLLDTRTATPLGPAGRVDVPVLGRAGVPATGVTSVVVDVTAVCTSATTALSVYPAGQTSGGTASASVRAGVGRTQLLTVPVGAGGQISVRNAAGVTDAIVDVVGYHSATGGAGFVATPLTRVYDTRKGSGLAAGKARGVALPAIPGVDLAQVTAVVANITVYAASRPGTVAALPFGATTAGTTSVSYAAGEDTDDRAVIAVTGGRFTLLGTTNAHVAVDVVGVYTTAAGGVPYTATAVARAVDTRTAGGKLTAGVKRSVALTGVPAGADALVNLVGTGSSAKSTLVAFPGDRSAGTGYDLRLQPGVTEGNAAVVAPAASGGSAGTIGVATGAGTTHAVVDVLGYYG